MKGAFRVPLVELILLTAVLPGVAEAQKLHYEEPAQVGVSVERLSRLDGVIKAAIKENEVPGACAMVVRRGGIIYRRAFGNRSISPKSEPMTLDSIFDAASLTKVVVTMTSLMILVEEGKLSLFDKVTDYIPEFGTREKKELTLLQLATHFSGLRPDLDLDVPWAGYDKAIQLACDETPVAAPDEKFIYSDINYLVLGEVIRRVSGRQLNEFVTDRVFLPLGMLSSGFKPNPERLARTVPTETRDGRMLRGTVHDPTAERMGGVAGHAGLFTTIDDTAIWAQMLLNGGIYDSERVLSPMAVLRMTTPQSPPASFDWRGLGFDIATRFSTPRGDLFPPGSFGHTGFTGTSVWVDRFSDCIVLLFTSRLHPDGKGDVVPLRRKVASVVAGSIMDIPPDPEQYYLGR